uniref:Ubiquitin-fold modifier-conjugating enzyme 1 n=1 Tax=Anas platyrhynchos TaxID=8839 RepID=A0A8B9T1F4_ANAPL
RPLLEASLPPHRPQQRWRRRRVSAPSRGPGAASGRGGDGGGGGSAGSGGAAAATDGRRGRGTGSGGRRGLKEEYRALIQYVENNKNADNDWFRLESNAEGTRWFGRCWYIHELLKYEFAIEFDIPVTYPGTAPEIAIPELDGKTAKMYRGGKICLSDHFKPLWARNVPKFGLAHLMALGLGPWLAVEIPDLVAKGLIQHKEK